MGKVTSNGSWNKHEVGYNLEETWSERATNIIRNAIERNRVNIHGDYDLFSITSYIEGAEPKSAKRDLMRINYTGEIRRCIEWMKKNKLI
jgi:hypothetical protein